MAISRKTLPISKEILRDAAQLALRRRGYEVKIYTAPGAAPGTRLIAVKEAEELRIAVRTSQRREVGIVQAAKGGWKTVSNVEQVLVAVPSKSPDHVEVLCFDSEAFVGGLKDRLRKLDLRVEPNVPIFVPLDAVPLKGSAAGVSGLKTLALWGDEFETKELRRQSKAKQWDELIARVTRDIAAFVGVGPERVIVDFRISSKAEKQS